MIYWPFRRKKVDSGAVKSPAGENMRHATMEEKHNNREMSPLRKRSRKGKKDAREPNKLQKRYSFSPDRRENIEVPFHAYRHQHPVFSSPRGDAIEFPQSWDSTGLAQTGNTHTELLQAKDWQRVPTLHKRAAQDMPRRKSSKKRKEEHDREAEIKAMSAHMPRRPAAYDRTSGLPIRKQSKKQRNDALGLFADTSSNASLPAFEFSNVSSTSIADKHNSFRLKSMFSPHPTIRYADNPLFAPGAGGSDSSGSRRNRDTERTTISREDLKSHRRVEDLANDLTAGDIRELMERDKRRRERKQFSDQEKMERKIMRRVERQRAAEAEAAKTGADPPQNMDRGMIGREVAGIQIEGMAAALKRRTSNVSSQKAGRRSVSLVRLPSDRAQRQILRRNPSLPHAGISPEEGEEPILATAKIARLSRASASHPTSSLDQDPESSISHMVEANKQRHVIPDLAAAEFAEKQTSFGAGRLSGSSVRQTQSWRSFFKRSSTVNRSSVVPSFSNTSRDSALSSLRPTLTYESHRSSSNVPKRTMSKFREDLPDFPISPPDSRFGSPETDLVPPIHTGFPQKIPGARSSIDLGDSSSRRHDTPTSGYRSIDPSSRLRNETPTSLNRSTDVPSPEPAALLSQSLASVDSEASWLSGRQRGPQRVSSVTQRHPLRNSATSLARRYNESSDSSEELGIAEDPYFSRLTPSADEMFEKSQRRRESDALPSSDEEDESMRGPTAVNTRWGAIARQPTVIHHEPRAKSMDGMLNIYNEDSGDDQPALSPIDAADDASTFEKEKVIDIGRATSINLGSKHHRNVSSGSAKLLDIRPRTPATDVNRLSGQVVVAEE